MKRILVIEDEDPIRENTQESLESQGFEVVAAENGARGLQLAKAKLPDLILCDIMMPEMDGYDVLTALRQDSATETIPVIFLTAKASRDEQRQGMELGADDYLTKPFSIKELLAAVATRLKRQERLAHPYVAERQQTKKLRQEIHQNQQRLQETQQLEILKTNLLQKLSQELRDPLSNINMAIHLLQQAKTNEERDRYITIMQEEYEREIQLLNEAESLQKLLTPENTQLLQRFKLLDH